MMYPIYIEVEMKQQQVKEPFIFTSMASKVRGLL